MHLFESPGFQVNCGQRYMLQNVHNLCVCERTLFRNFMDMETGIEKFVIPNKTMLHVKFLSILLRVFTGGIQNDSF